jgi:AcrR family transcriptional regulator
VQPGSAEWWTHRRATADKPRRPRADGLTLDRILDAALAIVDAHGLDALTVRRLADELGTSHPALYRHVGSQQEIVVLLVDRVIGQVSVDVSPTTEPMTDGRARAEQSLRRYREVLLAHPHLVPAFLQGQLLGPNALARREESLRFMVEAGMPSDLAALAYLSTTHFVISSAAFDTSGAGRSAAERAAMRSFFSGLPPDDYPTIAALADVLNAPDGDEEFELGLTALLDHITALVIDRARTAPT